MLKEKCEFYSRSLNMSQNCKNILNAATSTTSFLIGNSICRILLAIKQVSWNSTNSSELGLIDFSIFLTPNTSTSSFRGDILHKCLNEINNII